VCSTIRVSNFRERKKNNLFLVGGARELKGKKKSSKGEGKTSANQHPFKTVMRRQNVAKMLKGRQSIKVVGPIAAGEKKTKTRKGRSGHRVMSIKPQKKN